MISVEPLLHHPVPVTSYYIHSLRIDLLHSSSFFSSSLFFVSFCVIWVSFFSYNSLFMFAHLFMLKFTSIIY